MLPSRHLRDPDKRTMAVCGVGYPWPSSIALSNDVNEVTCAACWILIDRSNNEKEER